MLPTGSTADKTTIVLVFTPYTIALMQDQVKQLQSKDIPAVVLGDNGESIEALY